MSELRDLLTIAERTAAAAGAALLEHRKAWAVIEAEQGREVKIDADKRAEALILAALELATPFAAISEEAGWTRAMQRGDRYVWAVDPLDGSVNYLRDYPHCAVSIALLDNGAPVLGVVDCFVLAERFTGIVGEGAWLNGQPMRVSEIDDPAGGILQTGVPSRASADSMALFEARLKAWRKVRMIGSAASALAYVAAGRAEAYRESGSMIWDVAAGCALVRAAGGEYRIGGDALDQPLEVAAGNARVVLPA
ncbi:MAG TPA: inositol monophosphatase [Vitreimonas sp.]|uniref:inositol monophosphatase family protein n=1 Tax=Vitreimonas sp. TaxID=3069702 RepID=UPI002D3B39C9|nr:inositol monophosphatase [Vitreimonas sp.]HYD88576.1 inositol monophosphatase [Vitreimonas sp.]